MSELVYVDQSPDVLRLTHVAAAVDTRQFHVLSEGELVVGEATVRAGIIGASHFLVIDTPQGVVSEVFACVDVRTTCPEVSRIAHIGPSTDAAGAVGGLTYRFHGTRGAWEEHLLPASLIEEAAIEADAAEGRIGLVEVFPVGPDGRTPKTVISLRARELDGALVLDTVHSYPNEDAIVITRSEYHLPTSTKRTQ